MEASFSQVSLPSPSSIMPAPFWGGVKLLKMLVGEPFRPMVLGSISLWSFSLSKSKVSRGLKGSHTNIFKSFTPPQKGVGVMLEGSGKETCEELAAILIKKHII